MIAAMFYFVHFLMLNAITGAFMTFFVIIRNYIFIQKMEKKWAQNKVWPFVFIVIFTAGGALTWAGVISLLPICGMIFGTVARWSNNKRTLRILAVISSPFWIIYNIAVGSIPTLIGESLVMSSNMLGIIRFDILKKRKKTKEVDSLPSPL